MSALRTAIVRQFKRPEGFLGRLAGFAMLLRPSNRVRNRWTLDLLELEKNDRVFELGCGPGYALSLAARRARKGFVAGVDHSEAMTRMARSRLAGAIRRGRADIRVGDDAQLNAYESSLDAIYSANVIQFLDDKPRYFARSFAALAPGGRMATTYQPRGRNPSAAQTDEMARTCEDLARAAGFAGIETHVLPLKPVPAVCIIARK